MRRILLVFLSFFIFYGCEKTDLESILNGKLKTRFIYSSSTDDTPYTFASYTYDHNGKLLKELISNYPTPVFSSNTYEYSQSGKLLNKKYHAMEGLNSHDQTEQDFTLIYEKKYEYMDNKQIEKQYRKNLLTDSTVFSYENDLLVREDHFDISDQKSWSTINTYDSYGNLIKSLSMPSGYYTKYEYIGSKIQKVLSYDKDDSLLAEGFYRYITSKNSEIVETYSQGANGETITSKSTYRKGLLVEFIKYHPTFLGAEWFCERYEYY